jgi:anti-sigma factor RsiW
MNEFSDQDLLLRLLGSGDTDAGCDGGFAVLAEYVEGELAGRDVRTLFPAVAAHIRNCPACADDYRGLAALASAGRRSSETAGPGGPPSRCTA